MCPQTQPGTSPPAQAPCTTSASPIISVLLRKVELLRQSCIGLHRQHEGQLDRVQPRARASAQNLLEYLAMRREDLRGVQEELTELGISSLGRSESHVMATLDAVTRCLSGLEQVLRNEPPDAGSLGMRRGRALLEDAADRLLGGPPPGRAVRIMVTLPTNAADDPAVVDELMEAGMTVARINSAHDTPQQWKQMCEHVRTRARARGISCRILFDLAGPKIRTGPLEPGPEVLRFKPSRNALGHVTRPAQIKLVPDIAGTVPAGSVPVQAEFLALLHKGDEVTLTDVRGRERTLLITTRDASLRCDATCDRTVYMVSGTQLRSEDGRCANVGRLPAIEQAIVLHPGDTLRLCRNEVAGHPAVFAPDGTLSKAAQVGCTMPEALSHVEPGHAVWFDDGKIGGVVTDVNDESIEVRITEASSKGDALRTDKGINLPDTPIDICGLTAQDREALPLAAREVDMVGMSFVQRPEDVRSLARELATLGGSQVGIVLKVETRKAFESLPSLLLAAMESPGAGVMIARGDLAVEMGYNRLAEVQEEILWMCEAAHVPVIWATQVLETLAKTGQPSRAEVTDAAMAVRAECVMLNKGPHIVQAVEFLDGVLRRMQAHQSKKRPMLRALGIAKKFGTDDALVQVQPGI